MAAATTAAKIARSIRAFRISPSISYILISKRNISSSSISSAFSRNLRSTEMLTRRLTPARVTEYLCRRRSVNGSRQYSSSYPERDEVAMEEEAEKQIGLLFKILFAGTATLAGYHIFPYLGDNLMHQTMSLLNVKDPLFKRMGASRLARFATDDERRMKIVEMGGAQQLVDMLGGAKDDRTRKEALKAIAAIARSDEAVGALHSFGAISVIMATPQSTEEAEIEKYKVQLLKRFRDLKYAENSS